MDATDKKRILTFILTFILACFAFSFNSYPTCSVSSMPLVLNADPELDAIWNAPPVEQRGQQYVFWLQASFKIIVSNVGSGNSSGSGTLCYYDRTNNIAYVVSCGHLWSGSRSSHDLKLNPLDANVVTWYHNNKKLSRPRAYPAKVLFYTNQDGNDLSLLAFHPDWIPSHWFPIANYNYKTYKGMHAHSMGCDGGHEVAHYDVEIFGMRDNDLITQYNSPRSGRSGGGLVDNIGYFIGVCWGTSAYTGEGVGYFTPVQAINYQFSKEGYGFLLNHSLPNLARRIPIRDKSGPSIRYPENYIPLPGEL